MEDPPVSHLAKIISHGWLGFPGIKDLSAENEVLGTSLML